MVYEFWFARIQGVPAQKKICLRECMKSAEAIYYIEETRLRSFEFLNEQEREKIIRAGEDREYKTEYEKMTERGIRFIPYFSPEYPEQLKEIQDPPYALYVKGRSGARDEEGGGDRRQAVYALR